MAGKSLRPACASGKPSTNSNFMKPNYTDITVVLDRSGSMADVKTDTIGGFNTFLSDQVKVPGEATITLNQFDDVFEHVIKAEPIRNARPLSDSTYVPRGSTALLDAIGRSINETGKRLESMKEEDRPSKVVMVIVTDGFENASKEFTKDKVNAMISEQRDKWNWEFVFLGANQDAISTASSFGIQAANAMTYASNAKGTSDSYKSLSKNLTAFRCATKMSMSFDDEDRKKQEEAGV